MASSRVAAEKTGAACIRAIHERASAAKRTANAADGRNVMSGTEQEAFRRAASLSGLISSLISRSNCSRDRVSKGMQSSRAAGRITFYLLEAIMLQDQNVKVVQDAYAAFGRGDIDAMLNLIDDGVVWNGVYGAGAHVPMSGERRGKAQ